MVRKPSNKMRPNPPALMVAEPKESRSFSLDLSLGTLENIVVKNGQQVKSGDVIATYQNATIADQANEQAQSLNKLNLAITNAKTNLDSAVQKRNQLANQLAQAKKNVQSLQAANDPSAIEASAQLDAAQQALDNANLDFSDANAQVEQTRKKVTTSVTAPFDATVYIDEAGKSSANTPYATIVSPGTIVQATVTEYDYNKLKLGQKVEILPVNDSRKVLGSITNISTLPQSAAVSNQASAALSGAGNTASGGTTISNYSFTVEAQEEIHYGFSVQISVHLSDITIPKEALVKKGEETFVYTYKKGKVHLTKVTVKEQVDGYSVEKGLAVDEQYIVDPDKRLTEGKEVEVFE
ncbi:efflux RND transporter periplasmic adaptor subunit [Streptococcus alactolyticus]|uniref:efflux RND transporter periplasmic adaptor subunit n=3 Tax=Streptococcus TaxID=1301 RepID=UPI002E23FB69